MIVVKIAYGGSRVYINAVYNDVETVIVYNGGDPIEISGGGSSDHGALTGLGDDDHTQYHNDARGDARYYTQSQTDTLLDDKVDGNAAITSATKTKITYDSKGLVTAGDDLSASDLPTGIDATKIGAGGVDNTEFGYIGTLRSDIQTQLDDLYSTREILLYRALGSSIIGTTHSTPLSVIATAYTLVDGRQVANCIYINKTTTITGVMFIQGTQGNFTGDNTNSIAIYSYSGGTMTKVAETANDANIWKNANGTFNSVALTSPYVASPGVYFIVALWNSSSTTTSPTIGVGSAIAASGVPAADYTNSAKTSWFYSGQTSHSSSISMSSVSVLTNRIFFGIY
jgi:hypothetical protein